MSFNVAHISDGDIRAFDEDGVVVLRGVIDAVWLARLSAAIERDIEKPGPHYHGYEAEDGAGRFHGNLRLWETDADFRDYCFSSPLPGMAQQFFAASKINLLYDQLFVKEADTSNPTRWHNDQPYWAVRGWQVMSFWLALDKTTSESGALEFVRGSHKWDRWFQPEVFGKNTGTGGYDRNPDYETMPDIDGHRDDYEILTWDLEPGDVYAFHALTVHGSGGNLTSTTRRRGYTVRYTGDDAVYDTRPGTNTHLRCADLSDGDALDSSVFPLLLPA
jgi:ectoine hydroxylase-related dioxygenase (phytanoyl-CoA dioxygenase family)